MDPNQINELNLNGIVLTNSVTRLFERLNKSKRRHSGSKEEEEKNSQCQEHFEIVIDLNSSEKSVCEFAVCLSMFECVSVSVS